MSALIHPFWRWGFPGNYASCAESKRKQRGTGEEDREKKRRRESGDLEGGKKGKGTVVAVLDEEINRSTPLTGSGFCGDE